MNTRAFQRTECPAAQIIVVVTELALAPKCATAGSAGKATHVKILSALTSPAALVTACACHRTSVHATQAGVDRLARSINARSTEAARLAPPPSVAAGATICVDALQDLGVGPRRCRALRGVIMIVAL